LTHIRFISTLPIAFCCLATACHHATQPTVATAPPPPPVAAAPASTVHSPSGKTYTRTRIAPPDNDEPVSIPPVPAGAAPSTDDFHGTAREAAKLSIAPGPPQNFSDLGDLLNTLIPDADMRAKNISHDAGSGRLPEEEKLVTVTAFLYAASKESDNDFHCIVGRDPSQTARFMNVEVSGLPPSGSESLAALSTARNQFKAFFTSGGDSLPAGGYDKYQPPIPITVTGSLFFDVDHVPPAVGPAGMKPQTAWEIHPVSVMQFEP
jgi:hypothetical protein